MRSGPFSRDQRRWVYASSKKEVNTFGFGTDNDVEAVQNLLVIKHSPFPEPAPAKGTPGGAPDYEVPAAKVLGASHGRRLAFRPRSVVNISGMSYGSLSPQAVEALNRGAALAGCLHNTGEGGLAGAHMHGGELIYQIGTGYFGCRNEDGSFSIEHLKERIAEAPVRALEIKLSQGAKPGLGGLLPAAKVTPEIARIRGVPAGKDCVSPSFHSAFSNVEELVEFVEMLAAETGCPWASSRPWASCPVGAARRAHEGDRSRARLPDGRWRRGRYGRGAARLLRPRGVAVQARLLACLRQSSRAPG
jgi:hypothetical protein